MKCETWTKEKQDRQDNTQTNKEKSVIYFESELNTKKSSISST